MIVTADMMTFMLELVSKPDAEKALYGIAY